jgi:hypothetical protein
MRLRLVAYRASFDQSHETIEGICWPSLLPFARLVFGLANAGPFLFDAAVGGLEPLDAFSTSDSRTNGVPLAK